MSYYTERKYAICSFVLLIISLLILSCSYVYVDYDSIYRDNVVNNLGSYINIPTGMISFVSLMLLIAFLGFSLINKALSKQLMVIFSIIAIGIVIFILITPYTCKSNYDLDITFWGIVSAVLVGLSAILLIINSHNVYDFYE